MTLVIFILMAVYIGSCCLVAAIFYHLGREDGHEQALPLPMLPPADYLAEPDLEPDAFDLALRSFIAGEPRHGLERLASTGELRALYQRPYPGLASTGELRALALAGDADEIAAQTDAWKATLEEDG
jgi:hypothetical protein